MNDEVNKTLQELMVYCESEGFKGWDPYDGLNSEIFQAIPFFRKSRFMRLAWIQTFKMSPVNFRKIAFVRKGFNAKGVGLFLSGYCNLYYLTHDQRYLRKIKYLSDKLLELQNKEWSGACWGYNFDWQARAFFQPKNTPTVVATVFVASALIDAYEILKNDTLLATATSACNFVLKDLNRTYDDDGNFSFSYSPLDKSVVYNASLLGSKLLSRVYHYTTEKSLIEEARRSVEFCASHQQDNGAWSYGALPYHQWIDNFHTGYNLECISDYSRFSGDSTYDDQITKGFEYYVKTFFTDEGISGYYSNRIYPIDIHAPSQLVVTLFKLGKIHQYKELLDKVLNWTIRNMKSDKGYFYYQKKKYFTSKIPYMRWAQGWMFYALTTYQKAFFSKDAATLYHEKPGINT